MRTLRLYKPDQIEERPLVVEQTDRIQVGQGQLLVRVLASGVCHTDLHIVEGDISPPQLPITPGHQVVGEVAEVGADVKGWTVGEPAGIPWLHSACRLCNHCLRGDENLCQEAKFTGFHVDGGFAEYLLADANYTLRIPKSIASADAAPLLCAGIVGYRSLHKADVQPGDRVGLVGFGASAHLVIQVAVYWGCEVYVFTRSETHRRLATELGAVWVGGAEDESPRLLDRAVIFAPVGALVPMVLAKIRPGGTLALNAIHMSPIPEFPYRLIWEERTLRSVANATYRDGVEFMELAAQIPVRAKIRSYELESANEALRDMKGSRIDGAGVLIP